LIAIRSTTVASVRFTLDTNLLVYAIDSAAGLRHRLAVQIVERAVELDCWLTLQAISEFYSAVTRKGIVPPSDAAAQAIDWLELFPSAPASESAVRTALADASAGRASYWDALLVATAGEAGCRAILTEDLKDGAELGGVRIYCPFSAAGELTNQVRSLLAL
jgi:predicted nucleic acid-binding protein